MVNLKIQLFGGRGLRCGINGEGPGIGIATGIAIKRGPGNGGQLEVHPEYPNFPDPDYSNYKTNTNDSFIKKTFNLVDYKRDNHDEIAKKYLLSLNLNPNIKYSNFNNDRSVGYVYTYVHPDTNITQVIRYNLNSADTRRMEYKVKTMCHEGYHASYDGLISEERKLPDTKFLFHEETRTEMSAMFLANQLNGYTYIPSYTLEVVSAAAKYKRLEEYKHCKTLYDLGKIFYTERMVNKKNSSFRLIEEKFKNIDLDDSYYKNYYESIIQNKELYYNICRNSLMNFEYYNPDFVKDYELQFNSMISKISSSGTILLNKAEGNLFIQCVALDMNNGGIR